MSSSNFFNGLSVAEIDSSLVYTCISDVKDELEASITTAQSQLDSFYIGNTGQYVFVADTKSVAYDPNINTGSVVFAVGDTGGGLKTGLYGDGVGNVIIGSGSYQEDSDNGLLIGASSYIQGGTGAKADRNILIGSNADIFNQSGVTGYCANNVILSHNAGLLDGTNNIFINTNGKEGGETGNHRTIFGPVENTVVDGSICFGGSTGAAPSTLPRFQILSYHATKLMGTNSSTQYNPAVTFATPANINGYMRIRYQGYNLLVPVIDDPTEVESPAYP